MDFATRDIKRQLLLLAKAAAEQTNQLSDSESMHILLTLAKYSLLIDNVYAENLYCKALDLLPSDSKQAAEVATILANLSLGRKDDVQEQIEAEAKAARLAESQERGGCQAWLRVATSEFHAGKVDDALAHAHHALELFSVSEKRSSHFTAPIDIRHNSMVLELCKIGREAEAESLVEAVVGAVSAVYGAGSHQETIALAELADFHATQGRHDKLMILVEQILTNYVNHDAQPDNTIVSYDHGAIRRLYEISGALVDKGEQTLARELLNKILAVQRQNLPANNIQIASTLFQLGKLHELSNGLQEAESLLRQVVEINKLFWGKNRISLGYMAEYAGVLRKLGRTDEAEQIMTLSTEAVASSFDHATKARLESAAALEEKMGSLEQAQSLYEQMYKLAKDDIPYSSAAAVALENLARFYLRRNDLTKAVAAYEELIGIFDSGAILQPGNHTGQMLSLAGLYLQEGNLESARNMIAKARRRDPERHFENMSLFRVLQYAQIEVQASLSDWAAEDLSGAENILNTQEDGHQKERNFLEIANLWRKLGLHERADGAMASAAAAQQRWDARQAKPRSDNRAQNVGLTQPLRPDAPDSQTETIMPPEKVDYAPYLADVERRIKRAWFVSKQDAVKSVTVVFQVDKNGRVVDIQLSHSSGVERIDQAALSAIMKHRARLRPLPPGAKPVETFEFTFDSRTFDGMGGSVRRLED